MQVRWRHRFDSAAALVLVIIAGVVMLGRPSLAAAGQAETRKSTVTYAADVAPILQQKCQVCHRPGMMGPMSLLTYEDVRPWARSIRNRVASHQMPPWHLDKTVGITKFKNDRSLSDAQVATIVSWVDAGAPLGNPKDLPPPVQFTDEDQWFIGKPDLIVTLPEEHVQRGNGSDWWGDYVTETGLTEDRWIKAIQTRPTKDGRKIVHHAVVNLLQDPEHPGVGKFLSEYAVGKYGDIFPEDTGRVMKAGSRINFNMHYFSVGEETHDRTALGVVFYPKGHTPKYKSENLLLNEENQAIDIPPGAVVKSEAYYRLEKAARVTGYQPHMHMRGKSMCFEAILPDGRKQQLNCGQFDFNWHVMYVYDDEVAPLLPANSMLHIIGVQDNSAENRNNPDPTIWVGWGARSVDEMTAAHIAVVYLSDAEYKAQAEERKAKQLKSSIGSQP